MMKAKHCLCIVDSELTTFSW